MLYDYTFTMKRIRVLVVKYDNELKINEIKLFRGAVLFHLGESADTLFHHHTEEGFVYQYPKIQYKRIGGKAAIVCVNEGADSIGSLFNEQNREFSIGERKEQFVISSVKAEQYIVQAWNECSFTYSVRKWLPFNQDNYKEYISLEGIAKKTLFLERILTGNILSLCKGLDITLDTTVEVRITDISNERLYLFKNVKMMGFDIVFKSNASIPDYLGIGKGVSLGFGTVTHKQKQ